MESKPRGGRSENGYKEESGKDDEEARKEKDGHKEVSVERRYVEDGGAIRRPNSYRLMR